MAQVSPEKQVRVYEEAEEIAIVHDGTYACLRIAPTRDRMMPILVRLPENLEHFVIHGVTKAEAGALATIKGLQSQIAEQTDLIRELDQSNKVLHERVQDLIAEKEVYRKAITVLETRLRNLRNAVIRALDPKDPRATWKIVHESLHTALVRAGYRARSECSRFSWARWFGGSEVLPDTFFCSIANLPYSDDQVRAEVYESIRRAIANDLAKPLQDAADTVSGEVTPPGNGI